MPRRLIIAVLLLLIVGIGGGTVVLVLRRLGPFTANSPAQPTPTVSEITDPTGDTDGDGLSNADEKVWGTSPTNPDTDGDGFKDGEEVRNGHNPSIAAPNDLLPPGFIPGKDVEPSLSQATSLNRLATITIDPAAVGSEPSNLTAEYLRQYPADQRTPQTLAQFVNSQPLKTELPEVTEAEISRSQPETNENFIYYTRLISAPYLSVATLLPPAALDALYRANSTGAVQESISLLSQYAQELLTTPVPLKATAAHRLVLGYTKLLLTTFNAISLWDTDRVTALVGIRQLSAINQKYYPQIQQAAADVTAAGH